MGILLNNIFFSVDDEKTESTNNQPVNKNEKSLSTMNSGISTKFSQQSQDVKRDEIKEKELTQLEADKYCEFIISEGGSYLIENKIIQKIVEMNNPAIYCLDMEWSYDYADYLKKGISKPKLLDNRRLKKLFQMKKAKIDEDFVLVDELIWLIIMNFYGGGPEIIVDSKGKLIEIRDVKKEPKFLIKNKRPVSNKNIERTTQTINSKTQIEIKTNTPVVGITNNSFYCFINTALQCLLTFQSLTNYFSQEKYNKINHKTKKSFKYTYAYHNLVSEMLSHRENYIHAANFKKMFKKNFSPNEMHDCQEFMRFLLSELQDEMNPPIPSKIVKKFQLADFSSSEEAWEFYQKYHPSIIDEFFAGQIVSQIICPACDKVSKAYDPFLDISLTIDRNTDTIYDCFTEFCKKEAVEEYQCEGCKKKMKAYKSMMISKEPKILVIHLKRFKIYPRKMKINDIIKYPVQDFTLKKYFSFIFRVEKQ